MVIIGFMKTNRAYKINAFIASSYIYDIIYGLTYSL